MAYTPHEFAYNPHDIDSAPIHDEGTGMSPIPATTNAWEPPTRDFIVQPGENVAQLTKRVYGHNNASNRQKLRKNNPDLSPGATVKVYGY